MFKFLLAKIGEGISALEANDGLALKSLAKDCAGQAIVSNDRAPVDLAIVFSCCSKFLQKPETSSRKEWLEERGKIVSGLKSAKKALEEKNLKRYDSEVSAIVSGLEAVGSKVGSFLTNAVEKARLQIGTEIYASGGSLSSAVVLSGADKSDLTNYIGSSTLPENYKTIELRKRLDSAKKVFGGNGGAKK